MDFLDTTSFASVDRADYVQFIGLGNNKQKATAQNMYEADIQNRFPFSDNCEEQKKILAALYNESAQTLSARNSSKKGKSRNDLTGKLQAFDQYIPAALEYMNQILCSASSPGNKPTANELAELNAAALQANSNKTGLSGTKLILIGAGSLILIAGVIYIIKRKK